MDHMISSQPRYDHFDTAAYLVVRTQIRITVSILLAFFRSAAHTRARKPLGDIAFWLLARPADVAISSQARCDHFDATLYSSVLRDGKRFYYGIFSGKFQGKPFNFSFVLSIIIKRTETQLSRLCVFSLLQPHRTEVRLTGKYRYLTFEDRKKIEAWHLLGDRPVDIAARLSVHHTTIYKELQRGATGALDANQREGYSAELAERRLRESFKRRGKRAPAAQ